LRQSKCPKKWPVKITCEGLDSQTLAALGTAGIDHGAATAGLHANQKAVGTGAADFGRLVCAFHLNLCSGPRQQSGKPSIIANFLILSNTVAIFWFSSRNKRCAPQHVDKALINYNRVHSITKLSTEAENNNDRGTTD
jgi:hypothetical protein